MKPDRPSARELRDLVVRPHTAEVPFTIRNYRPADFDRLWQIDQLCFAPGIAYSQMELSGFITARNAITLVAEQQANSMPARNSTSNHVPVDYRGPQMSPRLLEENEAASKVAAFIVAHPIRKQFGRILTLDVAPDARRLGVASRLIQECEQRLRSCGCCEVYLETAVNNDAAVELYKRHDYYIVKTLPDYYASHSLDAFLMRKQL